MRRFSNQSVFATAITMISLGCGGATPAQQSVAAAEEPALRPWSAAEAMNAAEPTAEEVAALETAGLPASPWSDAPIAANEVPAPIVTAWENADNRTECAPLAPRDLGTAGRNARARIGDFEGGWSVEFDQRGQPGIARNGQFCARCGRGVFGIASTNLSPSDLVAEDSPHDVPEPSFADGSHLEVETAGRDEPVAATIAVNGCVYQVWSFLGEDHVRELVSELRVVDVAAPAHMAAR